MLQGSEAIKLEPNQEFIAQQLSNLHNLPRSVNPSSSASLRSSLTFTQASTSRPMVPSSSGHQMVVPGSQTDYNFPPRLGHAPLSSGSSSGNIGIGNASMEFGQSLLTPERFQQPVQMLSSIQHQQSTLFGGGVGPTFSPSGQPGVQAAERTQDFMSPSGTRLDISQKKKRRSSSTSGPSLDDQGGCG